MGCPWQVISVDKMCSLLRLSLLFITLPCGCFCPSCCVASSRQRSSLQRTLLIDTCSKWLSVPHSQDVNLGDVPAFLLLSAAVVLFGRLLPQLFLMSSPHCLLSPVLLSIPPSVLLFYASFHPAIFFSPNYPLCFTAVQPSSHPTTLPPNNSSG